MSGWVRCATLLLALRIAILPGYGSALPGLATNWGDTSSGMGVLPYAPFTNVIAVGCGLEHDLVVKSDGTVLAWGAGEANTGTSPDYGQSIVPANATNVIAVAGGSYHSLALRADGSVLAWGLNTSGQTTIPGTAHNVTAIAAGLTDNLALLSNKTVIGWGANTFGQVTIPTGLTNVIAISAGDIHSLALRNDGSVAVWGGNNFGQTNIPPGLSNITAIAAGQDHSLVLKADGTVVAWGYNGFGQTNVPVGLSNVVTIAAGGHQSAAVKSDGTIVEWGSVTNPPVVTNVELVALNGSHGLLTTLNPVLVSNPPVTAFVATNTATNLAISIWSGSPLFYQWTLTGTNVPHATNSTLNAASLGVYVVTVSNAYNSLTARTVLHASNSPVVLVNGVDLGGGSTSAIASAQIQITNSGSGTYIYYTLDGSTPDFTSTPYSVAFTLTNSAVLNVIAYNNAYTSTAYSVPITVQISPLFSVSATTPGGGTVAISPAAYTNSTYTNGSQVTAVATPASGWTFVNWTGASTSTSSNITLSITNPTTLQAIFATPLNLAVLGNGQVQASPSNALYNYGTTVQLTALPGTNAYLFGWAGAASGFNNPLTISVTNASGITALFGNLTSNEVTLTTSVTGNGSIIVSPKTNVYTNGQSVILTAQPGTNASFVMWGGAATGSMNPLTVTLTNSTNVNATFSAVATTNPPMFIQVPLSRVVGSGTSASLNFQVSGGGPYTNQWYFNGSPVSGATSTSLNLGTVTTANAGLYYATVSSAAGTSTSPVATVALFTMSLTPSDGQSLPLLILHCASGANFQFQTTADPATNWSILDAFTMSSPDYYYIDTAISNHPTRLYRAVPQ